MQDLIDALKTIQGYGLKVTRDGAVKAIQSWTASAEGLLTNQLGLPPGSIKLETETPPPKRKKRRPLTVAKVRQIKRALKTSAAVADIAKRFGVSTSCVYGIASGSTWAKVKV